MTDAEINLAIAKIEYPDKKVGSLDDGSAYIFYNPTSGVRNYIKYWGDIGPIFEREKIPISLTAISIKFGKRDTECATLMGA